MKFRYIGCNLLDADGQIVPVNSYGGQKVVNGDVVELDDYFSSKALNNKNYEQVKRGKKSAKKESIEDLT